MNQIMANGKNFSIVEKTTIHQFLTQQNLDTRWVVIELNGIPLGKEEYSVRELQDKDTLEIVTPMAGG